MTDSNIVYLARLHWILFLGPVLLLCFGLSLGLSFAIMREVSLCCIGFSLIWGVMVWMTYQFSSLTIKEKQIIIRTGFWVRNTMDFPLNRIESIDIRCSLIGALLGYGSLLLTGTGGTKQIIHYIQKPLTCRRYIEQLMHNPDQSR